jgi:hypothetical protein
MSRDTTVLSDPLSTIDPMNDEIGPYEPEPEPYVPTVMDADLFPDDVAAWAASVDPGSAAVKPLAALDLARLSPAARVDALVATQRQIAWHQARQHRLLALMAAQPVVPTPIGELDKEWVREDVACALRLSSTHAANLLAQATELARLPVTLDLFDRGLITEHHARSLAEATMSLDDTTATAVEKAVLTKAPDQRLADFRRSVTRAVLKVAPGPAEERHEEAMAQRRVVRSPDADGNGMSWIAMLLPDAGATVVMTAIDALARQVTSDDPRTADQRRADAVIQMAIDALHGSNSSVLPRDHGMRPTIQVSVALSTLLGLDEQPGELAGSGPIPASVARRLAADPTGTWRRLVTDPLGKLIDYGRDVYRPPKDLADHIIARDRTCRFRHCNRPACRCDLEHKLPWERGGETNEANLNAMCCRHHHCKHQAGWTPERLPDGSIESTSPTGHKYIEPPATYPIDRTREPSEPGEPSETDPDPHPSSGVSHDGRPGRGVAGDGAARVGRARAQAASGQDGHVVQRPAPRGEVDRRRRPVLGPAGRRARAVPGRDVVGAGARPHPALGTDQEGPRCDEDPKPFILNLPPPRTPSPKSPAAASHSKRSTTDETNH